MGWVSYLLKLVISRWLIANVNTLLCSDASDAHDREQSTLNRGQFSAPDVCQYAHARCQLQDLALSQCIHGGDFPLNATANSLTSVWEALKDGNIEGVSHMHSVTYPSMLTLLNAFKRSYLPMLCNPNSASCSSSP